MKVTDMKRNNFETLTCSVFYISLNTTCLYLTVSGGWFVRLQGKVSRIWFWDRLYKTIILSLYLSSASSNIHIKEMCTCFVEDNSFHLVDSKVFLYVW